MSVAVEDWDELAAATRHRSDREAAAAPEAETETAAPGDAARAAIAVEDWDDLAAARRRRSDREAAAAPEAETETAAPRAAPANAPRQRDVARPRDVDDYDDGYGENLRLPLSLAGGNVAIWLLAHLSGVVELIGVSFAASVGLLLSAYVLREWQRDRSALICLAGATPILITIFSLIA